MSDSCSIPPFKPVFGAYNPVLMSKPKDKEEFIANAQAVLDRCTTTTPLERQALRVAMAKIKNGELDLGDWPCIAIYLKIVKLAQNLDPTYLF